MPHQAFKYEASAGPGGKLELQIPVPEGTRLEVLVITATEDEVTDLVAAAGSSLDFWDNSQDDEDWNNA